MAFVWGALERRRALIGALALVSASACNYLMDPSGRVLPTSVAVLPFENLSLNPEDAFFAAGIHDETLNQLARLGDLNVISRTSVMRYQDSDLSISEIAQELNVETILEGSVRYADDRVRIAAQLRHAATGEHLWGEVYERDFAEIFAIQADLATSVSNALQAELSPEERRGIERPPTRSLEAYALYLRAAAAISSGDAEEMYSLRWSDDLDRAVALDPAFALAYARKAWNFAAMLTASVPAQQAAFEYFAEESAERALAMDPSLAMAHAASAFVHLANWRWSEAEGAFLRALELRPNDAAALAGYSLTKRYRGDYGEAIRSGLRAAELDPGSSSMHYQLGINYRYARDYEAAVRAFRTALVLTSANADVQAQLGYTNASRGNVADAIGDLQLAERLYGGHIPSLRLPQLAYAYARIERPDEVMRLFAAFEQRARETPVNEALWALAYLAVGDQETALENLRIAVEDQAPDLVILGEIKANPYADPVLDEPRFLELRGRIGS